jgi:hypothetical protein
VKYNEAVSKHDMAAIAARFTEDALQAWNWEGRVDSVSGKQAIQKFYAVNYQDSPFVGKLLQVYAIGNALRRAFDFAGGVFLCFLA